MPDAADPENPGLVRAGEETTMTAPASPGAKMAVTAESSGLTGQITIRISGWTPQLVDGRAYTGLRSTGAT